MDPKIWGRNLWTSLIHIAQGYPDHPTEVDKRKYMAYFMCLGNVLPCARCQVNYQSHLDKLPIDLRTKETLLQWLHQLHNLTLDQMDRKTLTYDQFMKKYLDPPCLIDTQTFVSLMILVVIFAVLYYFFYKQGKFSDLLNL